MQMISKMRMTSKKKKEATSQMKTTSKIKMTSEMKTTSKRKTFSKMKTTSKMKTITKRLMLLLVKSSFNWLSHTLMVLSLCGIFNASFEGLKQNYQTVDLSKVYLPPGKIEESLNS